MLAASGSSSGGSRLIFQLGRSSGWRLLTSHYCLAETVRNHSRLPDFQKAERTWAAELFPLLTLVADCWSSEQPLVVPVPKDRPVLLSALASGDWLITLDRTDFLKWLGNSVYHLRIDTPAGFLKAMRDLGNI